MLAGIHCPVACSAETTQPRGTHAAELQADFNAEFAPVQEAAHSCADCICKQPSTFKESKDKAQLSVAILSPTNVLEWSIESNGTRERGALTDPPLPHIHQFARLLASIVLVI